MSTAEDVYQPLYIHLKINSVTHLFIGSTDEDSMGFRLKMITTSILTSGSTDEDFKCVCLKIKTVTI